MSLIVIEQILRFDPPDTEGEHHIHRPRIPAGSFCAVSAAVQLNESGIDPWDGMAQISPDCTMRPGMLKAADQLGDRFVFTAWQFRGLIFSEEHFETLSMGILRELNLAPGSAGAVRKLYLAPVLAGRAPHLSALRVGPSRRAAGPRAGRSRCDPWAWSKLLAARAARKQGRSQGERDAVLKHWMLEEVCHMLESEKTLRGSRRGVAPLALFALLVPSRQPPGRSAAACPRRR